MMSKRSNILSKLFLLLIVIILSYVTYISFAIYLYGNVNELKKADVAIVLGAGIYGDDPSPVFKERINHSIWLYDNGYVDKLLFTGGKGQNEEFTESSIAKNYAIDHSVPEEDILIEERSKITQENISYAAQIVKDNDFSTVIIVSDPLHMKRAMLMARDAGLAAYSSPTSTTRFRTIKSKFLFLEREVFFYIGYEIYRLL
jgi:Uncharacterized conserved protein